jgi:diguanylate cyclase (GGDEF)-like protein/putative nucleotidyltransferase with HDIG domain
MTRALERGSRGLRLVAAAGLAGFALHAVLPDDGVVAWAFDYPVYFGVVGAAMVLAVLRAVYVPVHRAGWVAIAVAVCSLGSAEFVWELVYADSDSPPYPSWADLLYLGFFPASYIGVALLFRARARGASKGIWLDGLTAALAAGAVGAALLVEVVLDTTEGPLATVATNLAYPLGDVFLLALVLGAFSVTHWRPGLAWLLIGAALTVAVAGDSIYLWQSAKGTYVEGTLLDLTWPGALLLMAVAGWLDRGDDRPIDATGRAFLAVPVVCSVLAVGVLVLDHFHRVNLLALLLSTAALAGVVARLLLTFHENGRLLAQTRLDAVTDPVTGLGNRRSLMTDLEEAARVASPEDPRLLVIFDLKGYNDAFGHPAGDSLLDRLGGKLAAAAPPDGRVYRLGGDEFCLLAPLREVDAERVIDGAVGALVEHGEGFEVTSSFGAVVLPDDVSKQSEALRLADLRLYAQKHGKHRRREQPHLPLLQALLEREPELHVHTAGVARLADEVGRELGIVDGDLDDLHRAALLHDIGKLAIPDAILRKPGPLDDGEWDFIRRHTVVGERILVVSPILRGVARIVRSSHERWDGGGYPDGLAGESIPLASRVIAVCDAWDAMTTDRPYRPALRADVALAELERCAGTQFDPTVVDAFVARVRSTAAALPA